MTLQTLKKRQEFLRLRGGARWANDAFVIETKPRQAPQSAQPAVIASAGAATVDQAGKAMQTARGQEDNAPRWGFTITKRIGNAVTRNLIRRRLKDAVRRLADGLAKPGYDYVIIARHGIVSREFDQLTRDLKRALERLHDERATKAARSSRKSGSGRGAGSKASGKKTGGNQRS